MHELRNTNLKTQERCSGALSILMQLSPLLCPAICPVALPRFLSQHCNWKLSRLRHLQGSLHFFFFLKDHCSLLPDVQCFEDHCFLYFIIILVVWGGRVNLVLVTPSWLEGEGSLLSVCGFNFLLFQKVFLNYSF